ncbi:DUF4857 domain-containing protein [Oleidesulfovibrio alaskensis]|jgi:hypothetical protein|uniref:DUF4857 domain-containing protein n=1 Tax=Oleidesulfovibrio alaskensis TaxID=58180 RepID=UPI0004237864|nr:DUF4857 domain-containing protein [Oleidesulfovibrio alaskensis]
MNRQVQALLAKEWIKLRRGIWIIPLLLGYAAIDSVLVLNTIDRVHGTFGLWATLIAKQPPFFASFRLLVACGVLTGFLQAWPECQGKRLRLLFHMPVMPGNIVGVMVGTGLCVMLLTGAAACGLLAASMNAFHMPADMILPVMVSLLQWVLLGITAYLGTVAFFAMRTMGGRVLVLWVMLAAFKLLWNYGDYGASEQALWRYGLFAAGFLPLVFFSYLRFMGERADSRLYNGTRAAGLLLFAVALCAVLPDLYWRTVMPSRVRQQLHFSPVEQQFVIMSSYPEGTTGPGGLSGTVVTLEDGKVLSRSETAQALPVKYSHDLIKWKAFPESVNGIPLSEHEAQYGWQFIRFMPRDWNSPAPMLHMLLESAPQGARLEMPDDMFRLGAGAGSLEFLRPEDGSVDTVKSDKFTAALRDAGFVFPVKALGGNPDTRKEYDAGYLLVDAQGTLFNLQMVHGLPRCVNSGERVPGNVRGVVVTESRRREMVGFVMTDTALFAVMQDDLSLRELPLDNLNADSGHMYLWADKLGKYLVQGDITRPEEGLTGKAMTTGFAVTHTYSLPMRAADIKALERVTDAASVLLPVRVVQRSPQSRFLSMGFEYATSPLLALGSGMLLALLLVWRTRAAGRSVRWWDCLLVIVFGPVALLGIGLVSPAVRLPRWR